MREGKGTRLLDPLPLGFQLSGSWMWFFLREPDFQVGDGFAGGCTLFGKAAILAFDFVAVGIVAGGFGNRDKAEINIHRLERPWCGARLGGKAQMSAGDVGQQCAEGCGCRGLYAR